MKKDRLEIAKGYIDTILKEPHRKEEIRKAMDKLWLTF